MRFFATSRWGHLSCTTFAAVALVVGCSSSDKSGSGAGTDGSRKSSSSSMGGSASSERSSSSRRSSSGSHSSSTSGSSSLPIVIYGFSGDAVGSEPRTCDSSMATTCWAFSSDSSAANLVTDVPSATVGVTLGLAIENTNDDADAGAVAPAVAGLYPINPLPADATQICFWAKGTTLNTSTTSPETFGLGYWGSGPFSTVPLPTSWKKECVAFTTLNLAPADFSYSNDDLEWQVSPGDTLTIANITWD